MYTCIKVCTAALQHTASIQLASRRFVYIVFSIRLLILFCCFLEHLSFKKSLFSSYLFGFIEVIIPISQKEKIVQQLLTVHNIYIHTSSNVKELVFKIAAMY
jgi:hypothetical protein